MAKYRAGVIGLGWMGMLYDIGKRMGVWHVDDVDRPTPTDLDVHRRVYYHERHGLGGGMPTSYSEALADRPEVDLVAGADRDTKRVKIFGERYGVKALYTDAAEMLRKERLDIVAIPINVKARADLTVLAVEAGAKGIMTEKPIAYTLEAADRMVEACADAGVPLVCGAISTNHPSFGKAKELVTSGAIGDVTSIEAESDQNLSQHQNWSYFVDSAPAWAMGIGDPPKRESGSGEYRGSGIMTTVDGLVVHFRKGAPAVRITGTIQARYATWTTIPSGICCRTSTRPTALGAWRCRGPSPRCREAGLPSMGSRISSTALRGSWTSRRTREDGSR